MKVNYIMHELRPMFIFTLQAPLDNPAAMLRFLPMMIGME